MYLKMALGEAIKLALDGSSKPSSYGEVASSTRNIEHPPISENDLGIDEIPAGRSLAMTGK